MNQTPARPPPQPAPATRQRFLAEFLDAFDRRAFLLVIAVLLIQVGFVLSYVGAFHHPSPHRVPIAVLAPAEISGHLVSELNAIGGQPLYATAVAGETIGRTLLRHGSTSGLLIINPRASTDALLVAGGGGAATATAVQDVIAQTEAAQHRHVTVTDAVPAQPGDARGLSGFYLVVGWLVGGYLVAALLGIATRPRPATTRRAIIRLIVLVPYAILSGLAGAIIVGPVLGALTGHLIAISALGALIVYCAATVTMGFQVLLGTFGVGLTLILFVVLGNPSAGGAYPPATTGFLAGDQPRPAQRRRRPGPTTHRLLRLLRHHRQPDHHRCLHRHRDHRRDHRDLTAGPSRRHGQAGSGSSLTGLAAGRQAVRVHRIKIEDHLTPRIGLLFVAVSIRTGLTARSQELRNRAAQTLSLSGTVLVTAILITVPGQATEAPGAELTALAVIAGGGLLALDRRAKADASTQAIRKTLEVITPTTIRALQVGRQIFGPLLH